MQYRRLARLLCGALAIAAITATAQAKTPLQHVRTVIVDQDAWRFTAASFDQDKILSFGDYQYTLYWDADKTLVAVRRHVGTAEYQALRLPQYALSINPQDGHRNTVVGASHEDGRLHLSWDHHNNPLRYTKTRAGFLTRPPQRMAPEDFEPAQPLIPRDKLESRVTYPRFLNDGRGGLYFIYRQGGSGNGDNYIHRYDAATGAWCRIGTTSLFSARGVFSDWQNSTSRNAYLNDVLFDANSRLHVTWTYRETGRTWASNHDLHYAYSDDGGATWKNNEHRPIADVTAGDPIELADPGVVVRSIPVYSWLMNQTTMVVDAENRPHVITYKLPSPRKPKLLKHDPPGEIAAGLAMFHYWRDETGTWQGGQPIVPLRKRPGVVFDARGAMIVYHVDGGRLAVHRASADSRWRDWESAEIDVPGVKLVAAGKPDRRLAATRSIVSFAAVVEAEDGRRGFAILDFKVAQ